MEHVTAIPRSKIITIENVLLSIGFLFPLLFNNSQIVTGVVVNTVLFLAATKLRGTKLAAMAVLPSIGAFVNGFLIGKFTIFLVYFLPFIWVGNYLLMQLSKTNKAIAILSKFTLLYIAAFLFVSNHLVPKIFLTAMGLTQLITAIGGASCAFVITKFIVRSHE